MPLPLAKPLPPLPPVPPLPPLPPLPRGLAALVAEASVPEQLVPYVLAVSEGPEGSRARPLACGGGLAYLQGKSLVLLAYPTAAGQGMLEKPAEAQTFDLALDSTVDSAVDSAVASAVDSAVDAALAAFPDLEQITVLSPTRPSAAPAQAKSQCDAYWALPLPYPLPGQKLRNMVKRARRELTLVASEGGSAWTQEHNDLVEGFIRSHPLAPGSVHIFRHIAAYLTQCPGALLFSARAASGRLEGFCVGDYSGLATAFYMFAFRRPEAVPGTADALLAALLDEAAARGHSRVNLGLGIAAGIRFFKEKWGARPLFPYVETAWAPVRKAWWRKWL